MSQTPIIDSKYLVEMARSLKTSGGKRGLSERDRTRVRGWQDAIKRRMSQIHEFVPETDPFYDVTDLTLAQLKLAYPQALAPDDPKRAELTAEHEKLQEKYRHCSNILAGTEMLEEVA